jgi:hypothetical protein
MTSIHGFSQVNSQAVLEDLADQLSAQYKNEARELIVLQPDKTIYRTGTTIWFRVFSVSSNGFPLAQKGNILFAELADNKDKVVARVLLNEEELQFNGSIAIPENLPDGYYQLRAYTKKIALEHPADIFVCPVYITGHSASNVNNIQTQKEESGNAAVFFVEGDQLINGVPCTVVFSASDNNRMPVSISGMIKDNKENTITTFNGAGIGQFSFEPFSKDRHYRVVYKINNGSEKEFKLPTIKNGGYQLSLRNHTADEFTFRVALGDSAYNKKAATYLLGMAAGKTCFASSGTGMYMVNVPVNSLPHGVVDFYLYDQDKKLVSKRSVFNTAYNTGIALSTDKPEYGSRQKVKTNLTVTDRSGNPVKAVMSVSVSDNLLAGVHPFFHAADYFLLFRNSPVFFTKEMLKNAAAWDMATVTLSNKENFLKANPAVSVEKDFYWDGLELTGSIKDGQGTPLAGELVVLVPEKETTGMNDTTDTQGVFRFRDIEFYGKKMFHVMVPAIFNKQDKYDIHSGSTGWPVIQTSAFFEKIKQAEPFSQLIDFNRLAADSFLAGSTRISLQQLALQDGDETKKGKSSRKGLSPHRITGEQLDKLGLSNTANAVLMIPGVIMMDGRLTIRGGMRTPFGNASDIEPLLLLDGVPTRAGSVIDYLNSIPPSHIDYIEVLTGPEAAIYGTRSGNGVIVVKTTSQLRESSQNKDRQTILADGFYRQETFFEPAYDNYNVRSAVFNDNRSTVYWNGQLITDSTGKASFSFFTADLKNEYSVIIQGITEKGELIFQSYAIKRK